MKKREFGFKAIATGYAVLAALLYGLSAPLARLLLIKLSPLMLAAVLYLGAGFGMLLVNFLLRVSHQRSEAQLSKSDWPYIVGMIEMDIGAPIAMMYGLTMTNAANVALLSNFEIVMTAILAAWFFREYIDRRMWIAIGLICFSSLLLTFSWVDSLAFSWGSLLIILACALWGLENNCTRMLALKDPLVIVVIKGLGSGFGALLVAWGFKQLVFDGWYLGWALLLGCFAYGLSIYCYILAQRYLGAARTSAFYATAPFIGVGLSWLILQEAMGGQFILALLIMVIGVYMVVTDQHVHRHYHLLLEHDHGHYHDLHHQHEHLVLEEYHQHVHRHEVMEHQHEHQDDLHHQHQHGDG